MSSRREFLRNSAFGAVALLGAPILHAQQATGMPGATMTGEGYIPVRLPPKPGAGPSMTPDERDALERRLACPCPCTLDVFTCRTSMPCEFSPAIHRDVMALVEGGYSAQEIVDAFVGNYGEAILLLPRKEGFNWAGYLAPFAAIGAGAAVIVAILRGWRRQALATESPKVERIDASPDELARLEAALKDDRP
jgi:cytochrome c-type biogenesis protein CcmH